MHGSSIITPNMHLHCHLKECVLDYGPLQIFLCFPFERYNGLLGAFPNNNKSIEVQLMNRFCMIGSSWKFHLQVHFLMNYLLSFLTLARGWHIIGHFKEFF